MWVKVCGIRDQPTAIALAGLSDGDRPDAVGLNFFPGSRRCVEPETAERIVAALDGAIEPVGLFVNASLEQVVSLQRDLGLPTLQLHGDETPGFLAELRATCPGVRLLKAVRVDETGLDELAGYLEMCRDVDAVPDACLVDARVEGRFGGTGQSPPWPVLARDYRTADWPPLLLAGGLEPGNVGRAIREVSPAGVDTAGGVENDDGGKDLEAVVQFVRNARDAATVNREETGRDPEEPHD